MTELPNSRKRHDIPRWRKALYAGATTLTLLVLLEFLLWLGGVRPLSDTQDISFGFSGSVPLLEEQVDRNGRPRLLTRDSKLVWFNELAFAKDKPSETRRVFCVGGSTTFGRPYRDPTSFCGWLRALVPVLEPEENWEFINAGGVSYASYRVAVVMEELAQYDPDLFIIYCGQNEFLENRTYADVLSQPPSLLSLKSQLGKTRLYAVADHLRQRFQASPPAQERKVTTILPAEVDERLNHTIGPADYERDAVWKAGVLRHYELNLERMVHIARENGADVLLVTTASKLRDCAPFKGQPTETSIATREQLAELVKHAREQDESDAIGLLKDAVTLDPLNANLQFELGQRLFSAQRYDEALIAFQRAVNEDVCPLRAVSEINQSIHRVAAKLQVPVVDFAERLSQNSQAELGHACFGDEYFLDHVHPTIDVHRQLAEWIIEALQAQGELGKPNGEAFQARWQQAIDQVLASIDRTEHGVALRNLAKVLHWSGKFSEAAPRALDALDFLQDDAESRFVYADCLKNMQELENAAAQYELLFAEHPNYSRAFLPYGEVLAMLQRDEQAMGFLLSSVLFEPDNAYAHLTLGKLHLRRMEWQQAIEALEIANDLYGDDQETQELLELAREQRTH